MVVVYSNDFTGVVTAACMYSAVVVFISMLNLWLWLFFWLIRICNKILDSDWFPGHLLVM